MVVVVGLRESPGGAWLNHNLTKIEKRFGTETSTWTGHYPAAFLDAQYVRGVGYRHRTTA